MNREYLEKYADLIVRKGAGVEKGQSIILNVPVDGQDLGELIAESCYKAGALDVIPFIYNDNYGKIRLEAGNEASWGVMHQAETDLKLDLLKNGAAVITVISSDPELMKNIPENRMKEYITARQNERKDYRAYVMKGCTSWILAAYPHPEWAKKVFPGLDEKEAVEALWQDIFDICRINETDAVENWDAHTENLSVWTDFLNKNKFRKLIYNSSTADLEIELPEGHRWVGGANKRVDVEKFFLPNIPTEEVFCAPLKTGVNGTVRSTKPLLNSGKLIENFEITFKDGKIIDFKAEKGYEILKTIIETDEGGSYLGEVALVPFSSPISQKGRLYFNTLFDENASCHLAIGNAYRMCMEPGSDDSQLNTSMTHVDFMIGSNDLNITGITDSGEEIPVFKNGEWAD